MSTEFQITTDNPGAIRIEESFFDVWMHNSLFKFRTKTCF